MNLKIWKARIWKKYFLIKYKFLEYINRFRRRIIMLISRFRRNLYNINSKKLATVLVYIIILAALLFTILMIAYGFLRASGIKADTLGVFGDFFGGLLNPGLSFLSLVAILFTIILQNRELAATRQELKASRRAQEEQAQKLHEQLEIARRRERADATFQMLDRWTSPSLRTQRMEAWSYLRETYRRAPDDEIDIRALGRNHPDIFRSFSDVVQFISDLKKLVSNDRLDEELAFSLFNESVYPWFRYIKSVIFVPGEAITLGEDVSAEPYFDEIEYERDVVSWYHQVAEFSNWFEGHRNITA